MVIRNEECILVFTVRGKNLEGENFGESLLMKQMARKILANQLAVLQLFHCIYNYWHGKIWQIVHHSPNLPKFSPSKFFPRTVYGVFCELFAKCTQYVDNMARHFRITSRECTAHNRYAKQKHLGYKKVRGQSEAAYKQAGATKSFNIS